MRHLRVGDSGAAQLVSAGWAHSCGGFRLGLGWDSLRGFCTQESGLETQAAVTPEASFSLSLWSGQSFQHGLQDMVDIYMLVQDSQAIGPTRSSRSLRGASLEPMAACRPLLWAGAVTGLHQERWVDVTLLCIHPSILLPSLWKNEMCHSQ